MRYTYSTISGKKGGKRRVRHACSVGKLAAPENSVGSLFPEPAARLAVGSAWRARQMKAALRLADQRSRARSRYQRRGRGTYAKPQGKSAQHNLAATQAYLRSRRASDFNRLGRAGGRPRTANGKPLTCPAPNSSCLPLAQRFPRGKYGITLEAQYHRHTTRTQPAADALARNRRRGKIDRSLDARHRQLRRGRGPRGGAARSGGSRETDTEII